ncbi:MAG TPA: DUF3613 domain-containing protein [Gallionella sp.]|nr:DUF3613 domain-containing protein [Gallionella sp.]
MNHDMKKYFSIAIFLWIGFPLGAFAAETAASGGESAPPAAASEVGAPVAAGTGGNAATAAGAAENTAPAGGAASATASTGESAAATAEGGKRTKVEVGARTSQWLDSQREGRGAGNLLPIPGAEAGLSYRRYIDSFGKPIPEQLGYTMSAGGASSTGGTSR